jgi:MFS family permease
MKPLSLRRLLAITFFSFALTLHASTMEPAVFGNRILALAPDNRNTVLGLATFAGLIVATLTQPLMGMLSDRTCSPLGRRLPFLMGGVGLLVVCVYAVALAPSLPAFIVAVLLMQVGSNTIQGPWQALIPDQAPPSQHGRASALKALFDILAAVVGRLCAGYLIGLPHPFGIPPAVLAVSLDVLVLLVALAIALAGVREEPQAGGAKPPPLHWRVFLRNTFTADLRQTPGFRWWFMNRLFFWTALIGLTTFLLFFAIDVLGLQEAQAQRYVATLSVTLGGALLAITLPAGWLADRFGRKPLVIVAGACCACGALAIVFLRDVQVLIVVGLFIGMSVGIYLVANWALLTDLVPRQEAARYMGVANMATAGGSAIGRLLGGILIDPINALAGNHTLGYLITYAIAAALFALSALAILPLPDHRPPPPAEFKEDIAQV